MQIKTEHPAPSEAIIRPNGRMDIESSAAVRQILLDMATKGIKAVVVDLSGVQFMDSSGLSVLVSGMKALRKNGGMLGICNANPQIRTALRLTMLDRVFPVHEDVEKTFQELNKEIQA